MDEFKFVRAGSVAGAAQAFGNAVDARYLAGGQTLLPVMKQRLAAPSPFKMNSPLCCGAGFN